MERKKILIKKKKAQVEFSPVIFVAVVVGVLIFAPIMIRVIGTVTGTFFTNMNTSYPEAVAPASDAVDKVYNFFDYLIVIFMFINIIVLFISAWYIDTNPVWIVVYILFAFILVLLLPNMMDAVDTVWDKADSMSAYDSWEGTSMNLTYTDWIRTHMIAITVAIIALTGIITYAKFKLVGDNF